MALRRISILLVVVLTVAACSGGDDDGGDSALSVEEPIGAPDRSHGPAPAVIKDASLEVKVAGEDLTSAAQQVVDIATSDRIGGFMVSSAVDLDRGYGFGRVVVKVPAPRFEDAVTRLGHVGEIAQQHLQGQDLTDEFLKTSARVAVLERQVAGLLSRIDATADPGVRFQLRQDLVSARNELRKLQNDEAHIDAQTRYSTIDAALNGIAPPPPPEKPVFERAVSTASSIVVAIGSALVLAAGVIVPLGLVALMVYLAGAPVVRRFRAKAGEFTG